jgi:hypothetical protein
MNNDGDRSMISIAEAEMFALDAWHDGAQMAWHDAYWAVQNLMASYARKQPRGSGDPATRNALKRLAELFKQRSERQRAR